MNYHFSSSKLGFKLPVCIAQIGLKAIFKEGYNYKKAGVIVMGLTPNIETQLSFFNTSNPKHQPLMSVVDKLKKSCASAKTELTLK